MMREDSEGRGWVVWAVGIVPVMMILPMYVFPLPFPPRVGAYGGRRLLEIVWAAGLLIALLRPPIRMHAAEVWLGLSRVTRLAACAFLTGAFLSAIVSASPAYALREWSLIALLFVVAIPLGSILADRKGHVLEVVGLTLLLYGILIAATPLQTGFAHPRFQGQVLAVIVPPVLFSGSPLLAVMAAPALALGVLNGSRALMVAMAVVIAAAAFLWDERRRRMIPAVAALGLTSLLVALFVVGGAGSSLDAAVERVGSSMGRIAMWTESLGRFLRAPILGEGPGMLARAPGILGFAAHPHNSVMLVVAETGIVGLLAVGAMLVQGARRMPWLGRHERPWALALIGGAVHSLFSGTILMPASQSLLLLCLALVLAEGGEPGRGGGGFQPAHRRIGLTLSILGVVALGILLSTLSLPPAPLEGRIPGPRFYQRGIIP